MGKLFASGASVSDTASGGKEIVIQGDVMEGVAAMLEDKYQVREGGKGGKERVGGLFLGFAKENGAGSFECRLIFPPFILDIRCRKKTLFSSRRLPVWVWKEKHLQRTALFPAIRTKSTGTGVKSKSKPAKKKQPKPSKATVFARCFTWYNKWYGRGPSEVQPPRLLVVAFAFAPS